MASLPAGYRDRRLELQQATTLKNALNEDVPTWTTIATVWASRRDVSDGERVRAAEVSSEITTRFQVLYSSLTRTLTARDRVACDGLTYDVVAIKEIDRRKGIEITAAARDDLQDE